MSSNEVLLKMAMKLILTHLALVSMLVVSRLIIFLEHYI
jgi:hypothetical protein